MSVFSFRLAAAAVLAALPFLTSCSTPAPATLAGKSADFYWSAARETYAAGDYMKTADHLEHLIDNQNPYTTRAIPWYFVVTAGTARGYIRLADQYTAGARVHKSAAAAFHSKASAYRNVASQVALRFAQNADKLQEIPLGQVLLGFSLPKGSAAETDLLGQIAEGVNLTPADAENAEILTIQHAVLMAACQAAGAPDDLAQAELILSRSPAQVPRATFGKAVAAMLDAESVLYTRNKLDDPAKLTAFKERAEIVRREAARLGSARVVAAANPHP